MATMQWDLRCSTPPAALWHMTLTQLHREHADPPCDINAITNVDVKGICEAKGLTALAESATSPFIFLDCEGAERDSLLSNPYQFSRARLLVECYDFLDANITNELIAKYALSHVVKIISQGARNPFEHPLTQGWPENLLWQVISENRPQRMHWMSLTPKP